MLCIGWSMINFLHISYRKRYALPRHSYTGSSRRQSCFATLRIVPYWGRGDIYRRGSCVKVNITMDGLLCKPSKLFLINFQRTQFILELKLRGFLATEIVIIRLYDDL